MGEVTKESLEEGVEAEHFLPSFHLKALKSLPLELDGRQQERVFQNK